MTRRRKIPIEKPDRTTFYLGNEARAERLLRLCAIMGFRSGSEAMRWLIDRAHEQLCPDAEPQLRLKF